MYAVPCVHGTLQEYVLEMVANELPRDINGGKMIGSGKSGQKADLISVFDATFKIPAEMLASAEGDTSANCPGSAVSETWNAASRQRFRPERWWVLLLWTLGSLLSFKISLGVPLLPDIAAKAGGDLETVPKKRSAALSAKNRELFGLFSGNVS